MKNKLLLGLFFTVMFGIGVFGGYLLKPNGGVVIRVGQRQNDVDYDLNSALDFLVYQLEKGGMKVAGRTYSGELYPEKFNEAAINIFVRGFKPFFDVRMGDEATDVFYVHRTPSFYREEMRHFDYYLTSQKSVFDTEKRNLPISYFGGGAVEHERLEPNYQTDILYIYEEENFELRDALLKRYAVKEYSGIEFMQLTQAEREKALMSARVVVYEMLSLQSSMADSDETYVPYAVYDIISYGRPLLTNYRAKLEEVFAGNVWLVSESLEQQYEQLDNVLKMSEEQREEKAGQAREQLFQWQKGEKCDFCQLMKNVKKKSKKSD